MINLELQDLTATPVDIETFIKDPEYLGKVFKDIYPYWLGVLKDVYADPLRSKYTDVIMAGCLGAGRTTAAVVGFLYDLYILTLVKDPHSKWTLIPGTPIDMALYITDDDSPYMAMILDGLSVSPYFRGILLPNKGIVLEENMFPNNIGIIPITTKHFYIGKAIVGALFEEWSSSSVEADHEVKKCYDTCHRRMFARFMGDDGIVPCHIWTISSASGVLSTFLGDSWDSYKCRPHTLVVEPTIWEVSAHKGIYCGETFTVFIGDDTEAPRILQYGEIGLENLHGRVKRVPAEYLEDFQRDIYTALVELAGVPVKKPAPKRPELTMRKETFDPFILLFNEKTEISRFVMYCIGVIFVFILGVIYGMYGV